MTQLSFEELQAKYPWTDFTFSEWEGTVEGDEGDENAMFHKLVHNPTGTTIGGDEDSDWCYCIGCSHDDDTIRGKLYNMLMRKMEGYEY